MANILALFAASDSVAYTVFIIKIVLACLMLLSAAFIIFVVMKQSSNSDGMEAMTGSRSEDDNEYNMSSSQRKERRLKIWTFVCAGVLALCAITFVILSAVIA